MSTVLKTEYIEKILVLYKSLRELQELVEELRQRDINTRTN